ncbi:hypothetical protein MKW94_003544 [Papaver nudicaule]|uniref:Uncharacterized protein n=1 Tax=Papaver nudicaule TaxID=74823 RepID=A0AA42B374_PAPNU|nr:hypothetical protein [Papaver nudicaule]
MASNNGFSWGLSSLLSGRLFSSDDHTSNNGSHAGSKITGFNGASDNHQKYNNWSGVTAFTGNKDANIST